MLRFLNEEIGDVVAPDLFEIGVAQRAAPARVRRLRERLPVPFFFRNVVREVLFDRVEHARVRHVARMLNRVFRRFAGVHCAELLRLEFDVELTCRERRVRFRAVIRGQEFVEMARELIFDHLQYEIFRIAAVEHALAVRIDALALHVHDFVVFKKILTNVEVVLFAFLLRAFDPARNHLALNRLAVFHTELREQVLNPVAGEDADKIVFQREIEPRLAGVALTAAAADEL